MNDFDVKPVIRSCGERTVDSVKSLLCKVFNEGDVSVICEVPFEKALQAGYEEGRDSGKRWTLFIDADVLPSPSKLKAFLSFCQQQDEECLVVNPYILDKFLCMPRTGTYVYQSKYLSQALEYIPPAGTSNRPESGVVLKKLLEKDGLHKKRYDNIYALHDYQQFYKDIFRTCFTHAHKHGMLVNLLLPYWQKLSVFDRDYSVAILGACCQKAVRTKVARLDVSKFPQSIDNLLQAFYSEAEKKDCDRAVSDNYVDEQIEAWHENELSRVMNFCIKRYSGNIVSCVYNWAIAAAKNGTFCKETSLLINAALNKIVY